MARNYCRIFITDIVATSTIDPGQDQTWYAFGQNADQSNGIAAFWQQDLLNGGIFDKVELSAAYPYYILYSESVTAAFMTNSMSTNIDIGLFTRRAHDEIAQGFGLDPLVSPKLQKIRPWNGRRLRPRRRM